MNTLVEPSILTVSGRYFSFTDRDANTVRVEDIAHALSHVCRFTGHTREFYSVAQHSVLVSELVPPADALWGLFHDAAEAYLGDVSTPLKQLLPDYKAIEKRIEQAIFRQLGLVGAMPPSVKRADLVMLCTERRDLLPKHDTAWPILAGVEPASDPIEPWTPYMARAIFLSRFHELTRAAT